MTTREQGTFEHKRMLFPYVVTRHDDGDVEVLVKDAICPRCKGRASYKQSGDTILLKCFPCNISANYSPYGSYDELKDAVRKLILAELG